ncbi:MULTISPECIES: DUF6609 family protein [Apilactobacillus]|nr:MULTISPECIES: DUF6609 family protein [Apilactobacillus]
MINNYYKYNRNFMTGLWLLIVGFSIFTLLHKVNNGFPDVKFFIILYVIGMIVQFSKILMKKFRVKPRTKSDQKISNIAILIMSALVLLSYIFVMLTNKSFDYYAVRELWILILISVGIHFLFFIPVQGKYLASSLSILTILNCLIGIIFNIDLDIIFVFDGLIKIIFGFVYIYSSKLKYVS